VIRTYLQLQDQPSSDDQLSGVDVDRCDDFGRLMSGSGIGITMAPARHPYRQSQVRPMSESGLGRVKTP
jgi:hypothetical protein